MADYIDTITRVQSSGDSTKRYFLFSSSQYRFRREMEAKMGHAYKPGLIFVNGKRMMFTEISKTSTLTRYSDAKVVAYGEPSSFKYQLPG